MFIVLGIAYSFILLIVYFGDYKTKELEKQKKEWEKLFNERYK